MELNKSNWHYQLSETDKQLVNELRSRLTDVLTARYDTDFNLYRWVKLVDRSSKHRGDIDLAEKLLRNHMKYRKSLNLDADYIPSWDENPLYSRAIISRGHLHYMPSNNRYLLWVQMPETTDGVLKTIPTWDIIIWNFWLYECALRLVNEKEKETGSMSGVIMLVDVKNFAVSSGFLSTVKSGQLVYAAQLFHYEHYPELCNPVHFINVSKLLMIPYRITQRFLPQDFLDKYPAHDSNFKQAILREMTEDELPKQLGGKNPHSDQLTPIPPVRIDLNTHYRRKPVADDKPPHDQLIHFQIPAKKRKILAVACNAGSVLKWWFQADAEVVFGIYRLPAGSEISLEKEHDVGILERMEMVRAAFLILTRTPHKGNYECLETGTYYILFCNKRSWFYRRHVQFKFEVDGQVKKDLQEIQVL